MRECLGADRAPCQAGAISPTMSEDEYQWARVLATLAWRQAAQEPDQIGSGPRLENIIAWVGQFQNAADQSANDAALVVLEGAVLRIFLFKYVFCIAKYLAILPKNWANRSRNFQIPEIAASPETLVPQGPGSFRLFPFVCQITCCLTCAK